VKGINQNNQINNYINNNNANDYSKIIDSKLVNLNIKKTKKTKILIFDKC